MKRSLLLPGTLFILVLGAAAAFAAPTPKSQAASPSTAGEPGAVQAAPETAAPADAAESRFGPIQSKDPEVRARIKKLYVEQANLETAAAAHLQELEISLEAETDGDLRLSIQKEMVAAKRDLQLGTMELGLQIARLNGDERRAEDYEKAIDLFLHPDKAMPATLDPSVAKERARRMGLE